MSSIKRLIPDIYQLLKSDESWFTDQLSEEFAHSLSKRLQEKFNEDKTQKRTLRLSGLGPMCPRALWYSIHHPELAEEMPPWVENKFAYGHMVEVWAITLAKAAGHDVQGEQDVLELDGVVGHRDCVIDGCTVDVKSVTSIGFNKYKSSSIQESDSFGNLDQLDGYVLASATDPLVLVKDKGYIWAVDKTLGHMHLYEHRARFTAIRERIADYKRVVAQLTPPPCTCRTVPFGSSGNFALDTRASYSPFKYQCFPLLRTFIYSSGPVYLTRVVRTPDVRELTRYGKVNLN